jgi:hypothetical protein
MTNKPLATDGLTHQVDKLKRSHDRILDLDTLQKWNADLVARIERS